MRRFLLVGRVAREKLTKATQLGFAAAKESRQRSKFTAAISRVLWSFLFVFNQWTELLFTGFLTLVILYLVLATIQNSGQSLLISWFSCFSHTSSLLCSLMNNGRFGTNLRILSDLASCSQERIYSHWEFPSKQLIVVIMVFIRFKWMSTNS